MSDTKATADANQTDKAAAQSRLSKARKSTKTWINVQADAKADATVAGQMSPEAAVAMVGAVTKFATVMCVVIAFVKVGVYVIVRSAVVKTSALDSMGDLIANMITMYTGYRMARVDPVSFPIGQSRFEPVGVLIFSTLMAAMMFGNAIGNVEDILGEEEAGREAAAINMFRALISKTTEDEGEQYSWTGMTGNWTNFRAALNVPAVLAADWTGALKEALKEADYDKAEAALAQAANEAGEVETVIQIEKKLWQQNGFLACCATYKLCLWLFVSLYAAPKTGSTVLVALSNDKRNDFIATSFVITTTTACFWFRDSLSDSVKEMSDPVISLTLSLVIIYTWVCLMKEQIVSLSAVSADPDMVDAIDAQVKQVTDSKAFPTKTIVYYSSANTTVEVAMNVDDGKKPFEEVDKEIKKVKALIKQQQDVERVVVEAQLK